MPLTARQRTISKNGSKRATSFNKGKRPRKGSEGEYLVTNAPTDLRSIAYPGGAVALFLLVSTRLTSAYFGHVADCDETYNYWEPLHYIVYGNGLQTWEYSPVYAIRSYMPLWLFAVPAKILKVFLDPVVIFYVLRSLLGILTASAEFMFYKAVCHEFGVHVGRTWLALVLPSAGLFACSSAMLPSAWSNGLTAAALACWWRRRYPAAIFLTAANAILSWPFTVILGLPIAIDMLIMKRRIAEFLKWSLLALVTILLPTVAIDSWHYGRLVVAPWNIVAYNILTEHGPDLYGVEPWTYYFVNGFLNFNVVWRKASSGSPQSLSSFIASEMEGKDNDPTMSAQKTIEESIPVLSLACPLLLAVSAVITSGAAPRASFCVPYWLSLQPLYAWLLVFMVQPHKEERFLYPVYSLIVLTGAISLDCVQKMTFAVGTELLQWRRQKERRHYLVYTAPLMYLFVFLAGAAGISRTVALYNNYHGPMTVLQHLPTTQRTDLNVCFGKDWHRSPSSFHLREGYRVRFVKSEFNGQLPAPYDASYNATRLVHPYFNDLNKEDNRTYIQPTKCHYLVDSDVGSPTAKEPNYHKDTKKWEIVNAVPIIDAEKSHQIFRAFYVPVLSSQNCVYAKIYLLRNKLVSA